MINVLGLGRVGIKISPCRGYGDMGARSVPLLRYERYWQIRVLQMPLQGTIETFGHYIKELGVPNFAYVQLCGYDARETPSSMVSILPPVAANDWLQARSALPLKISLKSTETLSKGLPTPSSS